MKSITPVVSIALLCFLFNISGLAQSIDQAYKLAIDGQHQQAETMLADFLEEHPDNLEARLLRANNYAWWGKYDQSIEIYDSILRNHPDHAEAWEAKGYALAWSGAYRRALNAFIIALDLKPDNIDAQVGIGHTYIMQDKAQKATSLFDSLLLESPKVPEYHTWLGISYFNQYEIALARNSFERALSLDPDASDPGFYLNKLKELPPPFDINLWGGWSQVGDEHSFGLRSAQLTLHFNRDLFSYVRYDNSLGMDNIDFLLSGQDVHTVSGGTYYHWHPSLGTRLEYGLRFFPGDIFQHRLSLEQVVFLPASHSLRVGGLVGLSEDLEEEYLFYLGGHVPITEQLSFEPTYFYSDNNRQFGQQHRFLLAGKYRQGNGFEVVVGGIVGTAELPADLDVDDNISGMFSNIILPLSDPVHLQFNLQYENGVFENRLSLAGGINFRLGK